MKNLQVGNDGSVITCLFTRSKQFEFSIEPRWKAEEYKLNSQETVAT